MGGLNTHRLRDNDFGKFRKVVVHGSCHSRCMMLDNESDWLMLKHLRKLSQC
jgi:hypothetical protein